MELRLLHSELAEELNKDDSIFTALKDAGWYFTDSMTYSSTVEALTLTVARNGQALPQVPGIPEVPEEDIESTSEVPIPVDDDSVRAGDEGEILSKPAAKGPKIVPLKVVDHGEFADELQAVKGIGYVTAVDILERYPTKTVLIEALRGGDPPEIGDRTITKLRKAFKVKKRKWKYNRGKEPKNSGRGKQPEPDLIEKIEKDFEPKLPEE